LKLAYPDSPLSTGTAHRNQPGGVIMFKHILVPTDGSQFSQDAVQKAVAFAKETGARITAFYAKPTPPIPYYGEGMAIGVEWQMPTRYNELAQRQAQEILGYVETLCRQAGVSCEKLELTSDVPHDAIIDAATQCGCDLIFMASHGRRGISALLLGSETTKVLAHSKIPVLVYR
jgi:nucleotide-binding universal stress UspA family protein